MHRVNMFGAAFSRYLWLLAILVHAVPALAHDDCSEFLIKLADKHREASLAARLDVSDEWLDENMLLGYERTYTSPKLSTLLNENENRFPNHLKTHRQVWQSFSDNKTAQGQMGDYLLSLKNGSGKNFFTKAHIKEITKFLVRVVDADRVSMMVADHRKRYEPRMGYVPHRQTFGFVVSTRSGEDLFITLEDTAIEVNKAPVLRRDLKKTWHGLDERASGHGFRPRTPDNDGGGAHLHIGWKNPDQNLWLLRPDILAKFVAEPLLNPSLFYLLHSHLDLGRHSTAKTPMDDPNPPKSVAEYVGFFSALRDLSYSPDFSVDHVREQFRSGVPKGLLNHNSYISLKNIGEPSPRVEVRLHHSFDNGDQMHAAANLWLEIIKKARGDRSVLKVTPGCESNQVWDRTPTLLSFIANKTLESFPLSSRDKKSLRSVNGIHKKLRPLYHKVKVRPGIGVKLFDVEEFLASDYGFGRVMTVLQNVSYPKGTRLTVYSSDLRQEMNLLNETFFSVPLYYAIAAEQYYFCAVRNSKGKIIDHFFIKVDARDMYQVKVDMGIGAEEAFSDKGFNEKFNFYGLRRFAGINLNHNLKPSLHSSINQKKDWHIKEMSEVFKEFPEFAKKIQNHDYESLSVLPVEMTFSYGNVDYVENIEVFYGKKKLDFQLEFLEKIIFVRTDNVRDLVDVHPNSNGVLQFELDFVLNRGHFTKKKRFKFTWNSGKQSYRVTLID